MRPVTIPATTFVALVLTTASAQAGVTLKSLLEEMIDVDAIARWPQPEFTCKQSSSYDRRKISPDQPGWFANKDHNQYVRTEEREGRKEEVMLDVDGPGALVRFWLTAGKSREGTLRIYLDGAKSPVLTFSAFDLLAGDLNMGAPLLQPHPGYSPSGGGNTLYLPIPYNRHCKVTWEEKGKGQRYYQINYRTYAPGATVLTFARSQLEDLRPMIDTVSKALESTARVSTGKRSSLNRVIAAGTQASLALPGGPAAVRALELRLKSAEPKELERTLRSTIVQLTFDGRVTAWAPATDFFGSGVGVNELRSWYRSVDKDGTMRCRWVMPYSKSARITLINLGTRPVAAALQAISSSWTWDQRSMHFHATWHYEQGLATPPPRDWNYVTVSARGVYVGDSLALFNPVATWYGEGDEKIWVDGESFPSHMGTGTEDYYGYSYAPKGIIQTPFTNHIRIDEPMTQGNNVMSRTRNLDGIPFTKSLRFDMELISWKPTTLTYAATTYWYAFPGGNSSVPPQPGEASLPVPAQADAQAREAKGSLTQPIRKE